MKQRTKKDPKEHFMSHVVIHQASGCWLWVGARCEDGYGRFRAGKEIIRAPKFALREFKGIERNADQVILHSCDNPACVNPEHLSLGTDSENLKDSYRKGRRKLGKAERLAQLIRRYYAPSASENEISHVLRILKLERSACQPNKAPEPAPGAVTPRATE